MADFPSTHLWIKKKKKKASHSLCSNNAFSHRGGWHCWEQSHLFKFIKQAFDRHAAYCTITSLNLLLAYLASALWSIQFEKVKHMPEVLDSFISLRNLFSFTLKRTRNATAHFICSAFADWQKWEWALIHHAVMRTPAESDEFLRIIFLRPCYIILLFSVSTADILQHLILWKMSPNMDSLCTFVEICAQGACLSILRPGAVVDATRNYFTK